jgi:isoprenylcysteine carboxyl methyltransferase (ICMT) family protein YpbQ
MFIQAQLNCWSTALIKFNQIQKGKHKLFEILRHCNYMKVIIVTSSEASAINLHQHIAQNGRIKGNNQPSTPTDRNE